MEQQNSPNQEVTIKPKRWQRIKNSLPWVVIGLLIGILARLAFIKDHFNDFSTYLRAISISWQIFITGLFFIIIFRWNIIKSIFSKPEQGSLLSSKNLLLGIPLGIILGIVISVIQQKYLQQITQILYWGALITFGVLILSFILFYGFKKQITALIFGEKVAKAREITEEAQIITDEIFYRFITDVLKDVPEDVREKARDILPRLTNWFVWRHFRNWWWQWVLGIFVSLGGLTGTLLLIKQNSLLEAQNNKIDNQTKLMSEQTVLTQRQIQLEEANRRSALIVLMSNIMDKVDREIEVQQRGLSEREKENKKYKLSQSLIGQIAALSHSFKPYRYLNGDSLISKALSPERGQLLTTIISLPLDSTTFESIYGRATFQDADLVQAKFNFAYLRGANLSGADLGGADLFNSNLQLTKLVGADLTAATLSYSNLLVADLREANLQFSNLYSSNLTLTNFEGANLSGARFELACLLSAHLKNSNFSIFQASQTASLCDVRDLHDSVFIPISKMKPELFKIPDDPND